MSERPITRIEVSLLMLGVSGMLWMLAWALDRSPWQAACLIVVCALAVLCLGALTHPRSQ